MQGSQTNIRKARRNVEYVEECGEGRRFMGRQSAPRVEGSEGLCSWTDRVCDVRLRLTYLGSYCRRSRTSKAFRTPVTALAVAHCDCFLQRPPGGKRISRLSSFARCKIRGAGTAFNGVGCGELPGR